MFLNLFVTKSQVHSYGLRTASSYRSHHYRINLEHFTILIFMVLQFGILCHYLSLVQQAFPFKKKKIKC